MLMATQSPSTVVAVTAVLLCIDIIAVSLRFFARRSRRQPLQVDDWLSLASLFLVVGLATTLFIGVAQHALGYPTPMPPLAGRSDLTATDKVIVITARLQYIFLTISVPTLGLIKLAVLTFYRRIFVVDKGNLRNGHNFVYIAMMCIVVVWAGGFCLSFMFACKGNFTAWWTSAMSLITNCVNTLELLFAFAVSDFITDAIVILLPLPKIWSLRLPLARKLGVMMVFLLGSIAIAASLIRMIWVIWARQIGFDTSFDEDRMLLAFATSSERLHLTFLVLITTLLFWCQVEVSLGLLAACLPTLRGLFQSQSVDSIIQSWRGKLSLRSSKVSTTASSTDSLRHESHEPKHPAESHGLRLTPEVAMPMPVVSSMAQRDSYTQMEEGRIRIENSFAMNSAHR
ncbi:hypothetical protein BCR34DRAFT_260972 [Clohesyomyces aquaticus]|uniref:Rhodopsin domain-containing protein n=1 Tax=Clohesyomyces aquaticus TaxID=1231657 RepID=A0A1Y2A964_9PLEO|nr:hypothetical protein BCR34DRAFT_260972 [Clohesyomyces aquaticus]